MYEIAWVIPLIPFESAPSHPGTDRTLTHHLNPSRPQRVKSIRLSLVDRASIETDASKVRGVLEKYLSNERPFAASIPRPGRGENAPVAFVCARPVRYSCR